MSDIYDPNPPGEVPVAHEDTVSGAPPPATSAAIGGQIDETSFLGVRTSGPYAGMLLANNLTDDGLAEAVQGGTLIPSSPIEHLFPESPPDPPDLRTPAITGMSPTSAAYTSASVALVISGTDFADSDMVFLDDVEADAVTFVSSSSLSAQFDNLSFEGPMDVMVRVQTIHGANSNESSFTLHEVEDTISGGEG
jgi:hypothetical protein